MKKHKMTKRLILALGIIGLSVTGGRADIVQDGYAPPIGKGYGFCFNHGLSPFQSVPQVPAGLPLHCANPAVLRGTLLQGPV